MCKVGFHNDLRGILCIFLDGGIVDSDGRDGCFTGLRVAKCFDVIGGMVILLSGMIL